MSLNMLLQNIVNGFFGSLYALIAIVYTIYGILG